MKSVALYARVSSEQQAQNANVGSQIEALKHRAEVDGHIVLPSDVYVDDGFSGATLLRPALERLRDRAAEGSIDLVYVHSPDRLARRYAYQVLLLEELSGHGASVNFLNGPAGETAEDQLLVQVQGMIAEYERAKILERCRRGKLHRARQGSVNPLSGAPYGYLYIKKTDTEDSRYEVLLHEAKVVRWIFDWLVNEQVAIAEIVRRLNTEKIPTRRGAPRWDRSTVWGLLHNPAYKGKAAFGKTEAVERGTLLRPIRNKSAILRRPKSSFRDKPPEEWIYIDVPPIVSADVFDAANEQLERNRRLSARNGRGKRYLLQGLTVCAKCGYAYYGKTVSRSAAKGKQKWAYYRCVGTDSYRFSGGRICENKQVRVDQLDGYVWESICDFLRNPERLVEEWSRRGSSDGVVVELRQRHDAAAKLLATQERGLQRLLDAYEAGALELNELTERSRRVRDRIDRARRDLKDAASKMTEVVEISAIIGRLDAFGDRVKGRLHELNWEERRQLIRMLVARVEIDEEGATVVYRVPSGKAPGRDSQTSETRDGSNPGPESIQLSGRRIHSPLRGPAIRLLCWITVQQLVPVSFCHGHS